nr:Trypsin-like serine protease [uncultured bacterium]
MTEGDNTAKGFLQNNPAFCNMPWQAAAFVMTALVLFTFVWGFMILGTYRDDDGFVDFEGEFSLSEYLFKNTGALDIQGISEGVSPGVVGIGGGSVNMPAVASGAIVSSHGHVLTALHSVANLPAIDVRVRTPMGMRQYQAEIVKSKPDHDLVLLKVLTTDRFMFFPVADTSRLQTGDLVFAVGTGMSGNVVIKEGQILNANSVIAVGDKQLSHLLGTDAIYTWEQNGGPLVNDNGQLVGINLSFQGTTGAVDGYAVPAHVIQAHFQDVITFKAGNTATKAATQPAPAVGSGPAPGAFEPPAMAAPATVTVARTVVGGPPAAPDTGKGAAAWWARARMQVAGENPSVAVNTVGQATVPQSPYRGADDMWGSKSLVDTEHLGTMNIGGYPVLNILGLALLGLISGLASGVMSMGGGVIHVAGMMAIFGYGMFLIRPVAYLTNIFIFGAAAHKNASSGLVTWNSVQTVIPWAIIGVVSGYFVGIAMGDKGIAIMLGLFAAVMTAIGLHEILTHGSGEMLLKKGGAANVDASAMDDSLLDGIIEAHGPRLSLFPPSMEHQARNALLGLPVGMISGIMGISGGVVGVPLERFLGGKSLQTAIANSTVVVFWHSVAGALVAFIHGVSSGQIEWQTPLVLAGIMLPGAFLGGLVGAKLMKVLPIIALKWFYTATMALIAFNMLFAS